MEHKYVHDAQNITQYYNASNLLNVHQNPLKTVHLSRICESNPIVATTSHSLASHFYFLTEQAVWEAATICPSPLQFDLWPWKWWPTHVWRGLCANFSLPRPLCSRLRPDVRDRQTSDAHHRLMPNNQLPVLASGATTHPWPHDWGSVHRPCWGLHSRPQYRLALHACHVFHQLVNPAFSTGHNLIWTVYHASTGGERLH